MKEDRLLVPLWITIFTGGDGTPFVGVQDAARIADVPPETVRQWAVDREVAAVSRPDDRAVSLLISLHDVRQIAAVRAVVRSLPLPQETGASSEAT
jgi:hypothetical protein